MLVEGQFQSVNQFYLIFILIHFNLFYWLSCIIIFQVIPDGFRNLLGWHDVMLEVDPGNISLFVELQIRAISLKHNIASADNARLNRDKYITMTI